MSVFESGVRAGDQAGAARYSAGIADFGSRRSRRSAELVGRAPIARTRTDVLGPIGLAIRAASRLVAPTLLLLCVGAASFIYGSEPVAGLGNIDIGGKPLGLGLLILPLAFFVVHLTNRRYGAGYAMAQVFLAWLVAFGSLPYTQHVLAMVHSGTLPAVRVVVAFGFGLLAGEVVSVFVFDRMRGPQWWQAPFFASVLGGLVMCVLAYPLAYAGGNAAWTSPMFDYMGVLMAAAVVFVVPYWFLRSVVPPLSGFGGY